MNRAISAINGGAICPLCFASAAAEGNEPSTSPPGGQRSTSGVRQRRLWPGATPGRFRCTRATALACCASQTGSGPSRLPAAVDGPTVRAAKPRASGLQTLAVTRAMGLTGGSCACGPNTSRPSTESAQPRST